jgi:hypothetical protein
LAALAVAPTLPALAQPASPTPGQSSDAEVQAFAVAQIKRLASGDPAAIVAARAALIAPLQGANIPAQFRLAYSAALGNDLTRLSTDRNDLAAINALQVAAELSSGVSVQILLKAMDDSRPAVRYAAAKGLGTVLVALAEGRAAIPANQIDLLIHGFGLRLGADTDPQVVDAMIRSFNSPESDTALLARCLRTMCEGDATRIAAWRQAGPTEATALVAFRAVHTAYQRFVDRAAGVQGDQAFAKAAAAMSGQALAFSSRWVEATPPDRMSEDQRQLATDLVGASERVLIFAQTLLTGEQVREAVTPALTGLVQGRRALADFQREVALWTGPSGRLTKAPYGLGADTFR